MSVFDQMERLLVLSGECLQLVSSGQVEAYLALEMERRHLLDHLPEDLPTSCRPQLEQLQAITQALQAEVALRLQQVQSELPRAAPNATGSGYSLWA